MRVVCVIFTAAACGTVFVFICGMTPPRAPAWHLAAEAAIFALLAIAWRPR